MLIFSPILVFSPDAAGETVDDAFGSNDVSFIERSSFRRLFVFLDLDYAILLATLTGFSVLVPFIGAVAVTVPIALVAFVQFGWTAPFAYVFVSYGVIQMLDGNVLVPWLFSEVNNLHPVAIIVAVLFFGGVWGFWGVFFAIPLATLVTAILESWPKTIANPQEEA